MLKPVRNVRLVSHTNKPPFDEDLRQTVHVWTAHLDAIAGEELAHLSTCLDAEEAVRAQRFHFERDRRHFTAARGWLRRLLAGYLEVAAEQIRFDYGARGKPFVRSPESNLCFNLSHSHGRAMFVFARDREVGIDLEAGARLGNDWPGLVRRVFSAREQTELAAIPIEARRAGFLNGWTRKEAYLKATGLGIVDGLQSIEVTLGPDRPPELLAGPAGVNWSLHDLRTDDDFAAALVTESNEAVNLARYDCAGRF